VTFVTVTLEKEDKKKNDNYLSLFVIFFLKLNIDSTFATAKFLNDHLDWLVLTIYQMMQWLFNNFVPYILMLPMILLHLLL
jgi:hypothetical protein